jgi:cysteine desulfurase/selenocysteine lyase
MSEQEPRIAEMHAAEPGDRRADFPALNQQINGHSLVYLDSAASSQAPTAVIDAVASYQQNDHANVHRGVHTLSHRATEAYEGARDLVKSFVNAVSAAQFLNRAIESSSLTWNIIQTLCPGNRSASRQARSCWLRR